MRILFATEYFTPWTPGGSATSIRELAEALTARGHRVSVVTPNYGGAAAIEERAGVRIVRFPWPRRLPPGGHQAPTRDFLRPDWHLRFGWAIAQEAKRLDADVLHAQEKHALVGTWLASRCVRRPAFATVRDLGCVCPIATCLLDHDQVPRDCGQRRLQRTCAPFYLDHYTHGSRIKTRGALAVRYTAARMNAAVLRRLVGVVGLSAGHLRLVAEAVRLDRTHVVPNVFVPSPAPTGPPAQPPEVLFVGKLSLGKGFPVFLEAAGEVRVRFRRPVEFLAAGQATPRLARLSGAVRCLGAVAPAHLSAQYRRAAIVTLPSITPEASTRVALEAAAHERPLVVSTAGGGPESVEHRVTGLVVPRGDARALAEALLELLRDPAYAAQLGRQAGVRAEERLGAHRIVPQLLAVYGGAR